jgi:hypothetical protein
MIARHIYETSEDWKAHRRGLFTASQIHRLMSEPKTKAEFISKGAKTYCQEIIAEMVAPPEPDYYNSAMERGNEVEPQAVLAYAKLRGLDINDKDFIYTSIGGFVFFTDEDMNVGGTPDIVLADRICEIKCPASKTHLEYLLCQTESDIQKLKPEYYAQMQLNMYLTDRKVCDFVSFDDRYFDEALRLKVISVYFNEDYFQTMYERVMAAKAYTDSIKLILNLSK